MYWCDIFAPKALQALLDQEAATVIDISNIQEWARMTTKNSKESLELFVKEISRRAQIKHLIFSTPYPEVGDKPTYALIDLLEQCSWTIIKETTKNSEGIIYLAIKN